MTRRHVRYGQRSVLWQESRLKRVRHCGRVPCGANAERGTDGLIRVRAAGEVVHFTGLQSCGSVWSCPVCQPKILNTRAIEISGAAGAWQHAGNSVLLASFTAPHDLGMRLAPLMTMIADGFRAVISGRAWAGTPARFVPERPSKRGGMLPAKTYPARPGVRDRAGVAGTVRSMECTCGEHGWHPHLHVLVFVRGELAAEQLAGLGIHFRDKWAAWVTGQGYRMPHAAHGVDLQVCASAEEAGNYVAKLQDGRSAGNEVARGDMKHGRDGSRTPLEILDDFRWTGDADDLALWHEYETATKGHQRITWSKGLREIIAEETGWQADELTDAEIVAQEVGGDDIAVIPPGVWKGIVAVPGLDAALLDVAERSGLAGMNKLLARHGLGPCLPPPGNT